MKYYNLIKNSFYLSSKGKEDFNIVIWYWGVFVYIFCFFVIDNLTNNVQNKISNLIIGYTLICYFIWHIYITIKCSPKKPKLTKEEKELKRIKEGGFGRKFMRKLLLQESFSKLNPRNLIVAIDLFMILHFKGIT